jgi:CRISPR/Cas system CSM-associated protein Csm3 (group 7 of RAMP superfamily)
MKLIKRLSIEFASDFRVGSGFGLAGLLDHISVKNADGVAVIPGATLKGRLRMACKHAALALVDAAQKESTAQPPVAPQRFQPFLRYRSDGGVICQTPGHEEVCKSPVLEKRCVICRLFGSVFRPGIIVFADALPRGKESILTLEALHPFINSAQAQRRSNVKISRWNRVAEPKMLTTGETISHQLYFVSEVFLDMPDSKQPPDKDDLKLLELGAGLITHLGASKARGLGRCKITVEDVP